MKIERVKNSYRNMRYGTILQILKLFVPFIIRTVMIYYLGIEYLGLNTLFSSILQVLNLAELGVGVAMVYSMYQPIAEDDTKKIAALMNLYKIYYRVIGLVVCALGLLLLPFLRNLIKDDIPNDINIYILYLINLSATVMSYWLFAYKNSILQAHQRNDVISKVMIFTESIKYALQLFVLIVFRNYYLYAISILFSQLLCNVVTAFIADRMYPEYKAEGKLEEKDKQRIISRIKDIFTAKVATVIVYSADTIVISAFLGLKELAVYQNYYYLITAVTAFIVIIFNSVRAGIGNSIIVDTKEKVFKDFETFQFIMVWIAVFCSCCFLCLYQPFMELWVGKDLLLEFGIVICLVVYFYVNCLNVFINLYKDASGMWHEDRFRPLVEAALNLGMNLILVQYVGLYGIVLSTILSMLMVAPWLIRNLFRKIFGRENLKKYIGRIASYLVISLVTVVIVYMINSRINLSLLLTVICRLLVCIILTNVLLLIMFIKYPELRDSIELLDRFTNGRFKLNSLLFERKK